MPPVILTFRPGWAISTRIGIERAGDGEAGERA